MGFLGMRGTGDWVSNQRPENWREMVLRLYPNGKAPLTAILSKMSSESTTDPIFHWWEKGLAAQRSTVTGVYTDTGLSSAYVSGGVATDVIYLKMSAAEAAQYAVGHNVYMRCSTDTTMNVVGKVTLAPVINGASSYIRVMLSEADDNSTASKTLADANVVMIIGTAFEEGTTSPSSIMYDPTEFSNYTQIFKNSLEHTRTAMKTRLRTGDQVAEAKREALELHSIEQEKAYIFGIKYTKSGTGGKPERTTGGIRSFLTSNVACYTTAAGVGPWLQDGEEWLDNYLEQLFRYGNTEKLALCGSGALLGINKLAKSKGTFMMTSKTKDYGIQVVEWVTPFGTIYLKTHPLFSYEPTLRNSILLVEPAQLTYRYVDDTKYEPNIQANDQDGEKSQYKTEAGLELHFEKAHGWLDCIGLNP